jgi:hypothetical protein
MKCPICKNNFDEHTGRRPKKFCSDSCKVKFWNAQKKVAINNKPENKKEIEKERHIPNNTGKKYKDSQAVPATGVMSEMEKQFQEILNQKKNGSKA